MQFYEFKETQERVILIGVQTEVGDDVEASLDELEELAETAGAETVAKVIQNREAVHPIENQREAIIRSIREETKNR